MPTTYVWETRGRRQSLVLPWWLERRLPAQRDIDAGKYQLEEPRRQVSCPPLQQRTIHRNHLTHVRD